ncbi:ATP synthase F1 subunit delta [Flavitalea sp. BT771]|uniref:ATP synthase F1 subunit delta n=1 Tax=Flavitalea sp. BT771 TaxID=3063329 RepID=UPI0026E44B7D|nr:ATP synthase F1 subunit delta [Flavitalea sp. BT771]MDO6434006.1 ATP synthase F1 subunit delta [Flavitalea sp. BT771]MDV6222906.1 ATP synthase F1 subunit delta [Flavitalea sp. BT771]
MPNPRLAGRYAKSLIDLALEKGQLEEVYHDMLFLQQAFRSSKELVVMIKSPVIKADKKDKVLDAITAGKTSVITSTFTKLLLRKGREFFLPEIITAFIDQYKEYKGIHTVKLTTAIPVSEELKKSIVDKIKADKHLKDIELLTAVDESLIGGFVLEVGDELVDGSIAFDLKNIKKQFQNNDFIYKIR